MESRKQGKLEWTRDLFSGVKALVIYYLVSQLVAILGFSTLNSWLENGKNMSGYELYLETGVKMAAMFLGALSVFPYYRKENEYEKEEIILSKERRIFLGTGVLIMCAGAVISLVLNYVFSALGFIQNSESYQQVAAKQFALPLWLAFLFYGILSPWAEEVVFRGIFYRFLRRNMTEAVAVFGSAFAFGMFHGNLVQMVYGTIMGVIMALMYGRFRNLLAPVLFHGAANVAIYVVSYFFSH